MTDPGNAPRFPGKDVWFDFWNVRVVLPETGRYFHLMPHVVAGEGADTGARGLWVLDGGNGGPSGESEAGEERVGEEFGSEEGGLGLTWERDGVACRFADTRIDASGPSTRWEVEIEPWLKDGSPEDSRRQEAEDKYLLHRSPFVHRVPCMKARARGVIEQGGERHEFEDGLVYQAHNYGPRFPDGWLWVHALCFDREEGLAFEAASQPGPDGPQGLVRVARPDGTRVLSTLAGDRVEVTRHDDVYSVRARSKESDIWVTATAKRGEAVGFSFCRPDGGRFDVDESFLGTVTLSISGRPFKGGLVAVGRASRRDQAG